MKNLRYLITVLALVNAGLIAQAAAAPMTSGATSVGTTSINPIPQRSGLGYGTE